MSRDITAASLAALQSANVPLLALVEMDFSGGFLRLTNATYEFTWNGFTWLGAGNLGTISAVQEGAGLEARGVSLAISGVNSAHIATALAEQYQGRSCKIYAAPLDADYRILTDPILLFSGRMDTMRVSLGQTATIEVTAESRLIDLERPRIRRYNDADQRAEYPNDRGFEFVEQMVEKELRWGAS